jgi:hypothetical protein
MKHKKILVSLSIIAGIALVVLAVVYWVTPAGSLPSYMPGFDASPAGASHIHFKHGLGSFILGFALFAYAWFTTGKKAEIVH